YLVTDKFNITVKGELTAEEIRNLKNIDDPSKVVLRKEKDIANINFTFGPYVKIIIIVIAILLLGMIIYFVLYKFVFKKKNSESVKLKLPPYENFLKNISQISFDPNDERVVTENKLSILTEVLKELIYDEYQLNAPSETTKELIRSLRDIGFKEEIVLEMNTLYTEIDLIKFAKAPYNYDRLVVFVNKIKDLGSKINQDYKAKLSEVDNVNI
ncbi:MAG TPA: hypothetical protein PK771_12935, partial [Spirochaetota bacterium]|nr:hypothetical protein [Spirochaetota bacterium]